MIDIIIPFWNQSDFTLKCLASIAKYSSDYRIILINNGSDISESSKLNELLSYLPHILINNDKNLGFIKATNQGIKESTAPYIVLMNNDTEAAPKWLEKLKEPLVDDVGLSGPVTTAKRSWQGRWNKKGGIYILPPGRMLAFFCTMIRRDVIEKVGLLDESFGMGFGDDDDYCVRASKAGFKLALVQDLVIPHHHRTTFTKIFGAKKVQEMQAVAIKKFREKHKN
jgi:GT2 family glycosyltransferase